MDANFNYENLNDTRILFAQAIWLSDYCMASEQYEEFISLLPKDAPAAECLTGICCTDFVMDKSIIDSTVYLLANLPLLIFTPKNQLVELVGPEAAQLVE